MQISYKDTFFLEKKLRLLDIAQLLSIFLK